MIRHPRRTGFIAFNIIAAGLFVLAFGISVTGGAEGVAAIPNMVLGTTAMVVIAVVWAATWIAWGWMVWLRRRRVIRHGHGPA